VKFGLVSLEEEEEEEEEEGPETRRTAFSIQGTGKHKLWVSFSFVFFLDVYIGLIILELSLKAFIFFFHFDVSKSVFFYSILSPTQQILS
jgi:hypothetical protein